MGLQRFYVFSLRTFLAMADCELNSLSLIEGLETITLDGAEMNEYIRPVVLLDEAIPLGFVEKFYLTGDGVRHVSILN
jgi:hypothetical protein